MSGDKKSIDEEEGARFEKALAPCRNCNHAKLPHLLIQNKCVDGTLNVTGHYEQCSCRNFEPKDNLEYLEYKYDKKKGKDK
jgi:hypothetical protein